MFTFSRPDLTLLREGSRRSFIFLALREDAKKKNMTHFFIIKTNSFNGKQYSFVKLFFAYYLLLFILKFIINEIKKNTFGAMF